MTCYIYRRIPQELTRRQHRAQLRTQRRNRLRANKAKYAGLTRRQRDFVTSNLQLWAIEKRAAQEGGAA